MVTSIVCKMVVVVVEVVVVVGVDNDDGGGCDFVTMVIEMAIMTVE